MKITLIQDFSKLHEQLKTDEPSVVTIGNFDGCHLGHQVLLKKALDLSKRKKLRSIVVTFEPSPRLIFRKGVTDQNLFTLKQKKTIFSELGFDHMLLIHFNKEFSRFSHEYFYNDFLRKSLKTQYLVLGANFFFGQGKKGNITWLEKKCREDGIKLEVFRKELKGVGLISSSGIRQTLLEQGDVEFANKALGRMYCVMGTVVKGKQLGRTFGVPTLNVHVSNQIVPKTGVYCGYLHFSSQEKLKILAPSDPLLPAVCNIGYRPTVAFDFENKISFEVHLIDQKLPADSCYGKNILFFFFKRLRSEKKFSTIDELKDQIEKDIVSAKDQL